MKATIKIFISVFLVLASTSEGTALVSEEETRAAWHDVARNVGMENIALSFREDDTPNAWVQSGGPVTVTTALMNLLENTEEMFGVLAHEAGHVALRHHQGSAANSAGLSVLAYMLGRAIGNSDLGNAAVGIGANLAQAGYSREQEIEADDFAVDLAFDSGHDPTGLYVALKRLSLRGNRTQPSGFNSHPPDDRRLKHISERILARDAKVKIPEVVSKDK